MVTKTLETSVHLENVNENPEVCGTIRQSTVISSYDISTALKVYEKVKRCFFKQDHRHLSVSISLQDHFDDSHHGDSGALCNLAMGLAKDKTMKIKSMSESPWSNSEQKS